MAIPKNLPTRTNSNPNPVTEQEPKPMNKPTSIAAAVKPAQDAAAQASRNHVAQSSALKRLTGIAGVSARQNSEWFQPGEYTVRVERVREGETRAPALRPFIAIDCVVLASTGDKAVRPGHKVTQMIMLDKDAAPGDVRAFLDAVVEARGQDEAVDDDFLVGACSVENPLQGTVLNVVAVMIKTKAGGDFTRLTWAAPTEDAPATNF